MDKFEAIRHNITVWEKRLGLKVICNTTDAIVCSAMTYHSCEKVVGMALVIAWIVKERYPFLNRDERRAVSLMTAIQHYRPDESDLSQPTYENTIVLSIATYIGGLRRSVEGYRKPTAGVKMANVILNKRRRVVVDIKETGDLLLDGYM